MHGYFYWFRKKILLHKIIVNLEIKIEFKSILIPFFSSFIPLQLQHTKRRYVGIFYKPRKARFIPTFCKKINHTSTAVGKLMTAFEERRQTTFNVTKFIYNNNKQGFTPNGTNNEYVRVHKRVQDSDRW